MLGHKVERFARSLWPSATDCSAIMAALAISSERLAPAFRFSHFHDGSLLHAGSLLSFRLAPSRRFSPYSAASLCSPGALWDTWLAPLSRSSRVCSARSISSVLSFHAVMALRSLLGGGALRPFP
jgi:hypothetical protein